MKGHTYQRGKTWTYVIDAGKDSITGKRIQKTKGGFRTKGECQKAMDEMKYLITHDSDYQGVYVSKKKVHTVGECVEEYLEYKKESVKYSTYYNLVKNFSRLKAIYNVNIQNVQLHDLVELLDKAPTMKHRTKTYYCCDWRSWLSYCVERNYIDKNVLEKYVIEQPKLTLENIEEQDMHQFFYEKDEVNHILSEIDIIKNQNFKKFQDCLIIRIGIFTGMRIGEILALEWKDIQGNILKVYKTVNHVYIRSRTYNLTIAKTKSSIRDVVVTEDIINELKIQKRNVEKIKETICDWNTQHDFVFPNFETGLPSQYELVKYRYKKILEKIKARTLSLHKLRHTHCSLLAHAHIPLHMIGARLGHSEADKTTKQVYLHISQEYNENMAIKFNEILTQNK